MFTAEPNPIGVVMPDAVLLLSILLPPPTIINGVPVAVDCANSPATNFGISLFAPPAPVYLTNNVFGLLPSAASTARTSAVT